MQVMVHDEITVTYTFMLLFGGASGERSKYYIIEINGMR